MSKRILAVARRTLHHWHREQVLKTARQELDDRGLADIGLSRTRGPMDFTFERLPGWADTKTKMRKF